MNNLKDIVFSTNNQKVLSFLLENPDKKFFDREISKLTGISRAGTNFALRKLAEVGLLDVSKKGRMNFYSVKILDVITRYLKIIQNILTLHKLVESLKEETIKIILYGSASRGENTSESDVDLFVLTNNKADAESKIFRHQLRDKLRSVIKTPNDFLKIKKENPIFCDEVERGIILWQAKQA